MGRAGDARAADAAAALDIMFGIDGAVTTVRLMTNDDESRRSRG